MLKVGGTARSLLEDTDRSGSNPYEHCKSWAHRDHTENSDWRFTDQDSQCHLFILDLLSFMSIQKWSKLFFHNEGKKKAKTNPVLIFSVRLVLSFMLLLLHLNQWLRCILNVTVVRLFLCPFNVLDSHVTKPLSVTSQAVWLNWIRVNTGTLLLISR